MAIIFYFAQQYSNFMVVLSGFVIMIPILSNIIYQYNQLPFHDCILQFKFFSFIHPSGTVFFSQDAPYCPAMDI